MSAPVPPMRQHPPSPRVQSGTQRTATTWWLGAAGALVGGVVVGIALLAVWPVWFLTFPLWLLASVAGAVPSFVLSGRRPHLLVVGIALLAAVPVSIVTFVGWFALNT